jgi:ankyrin repeat protein
MNVGHLALLLLITFTLGCAHHDDRSNWVFLPEHPGSTSMLSAIYAGDEEMARALFKRGAPINIVTKYGSLLDLAASKRMDMLVLDLLNAGADPNLGHTDKVQPAIHTYATTRNMEILKAFLAAGVDLETRRKDGMTALAVALDESMLTSAKVFILAGANVNAVYEDRSLLMHMAEKNNMLLANLLIKHGADPSFTNSKQESVYTIAIPGSPFQLMLPSQSPQPLIANDEVQPKS